MNTFYSYKNIKYDDKWEAACFFWFQFLIGFLFTFDLPSKEWSLDATLSCVSCEPYLVWHYTAQIWTVTQRDLQEGSQHYVSHPWGLRVERIFCNYQKEINVEKEKFVFKTLFEKKPWRVSKMTRIWVSTCCQWFFCLLITSLPSDNFYQVW